MQSQFPEVILCKYGEIVLKGSNRNVFETKLVKEIRRRLYPLGAFRVWYGQSIIYIEPLSDACDMDAAYEAAKKVFGVIGVTRAAVCEKNMEAIRAAAQSFLPDKLTHARTFKVEARRSDKSFPLTSPQIAAEIGGVILASVRGIRVDVRHPDVTVTVEIRDSFAYLRAGQEDGAGGLPFATSGRGLLLLSGGIDSPVAGLMMAKRGLAIEALHFDSFPYTSERAREKVLSLAEKMTEYCSRIYVHIISLTHIQEELRDRCDEEYFTLLLRVFMMRLAERCAREYRLSALITGESLGQVASQTLAAIGVTDSVVSLPVFRPLIGMDKKEIIREAEKYGTFDTSILPFEDCCTVFTPRHPKTQPKIEAVMEQLARVDAEALIEEAYATMITECKVIYPGYTVR